MTRLWLAVAFLAGSLIAFLALQVFRLSGGVRNLNERAAALDLAYREVHQLQQVTATLNQSNFERLDAGLGALQERVPDLDRAWRDRLDSDFAELQQRVARLDQVYYDPGYLPARPPLPGQKIPVSLLWTDYHERALGIFTGPWTIQSIVIAVANGSLSFDEVMAAIGLKTGDDRRPYFGNIVNALVGRGVLRTVGTHVDKFELSDEGRRIWAAYKQIPKWFIDLTEEWQVGDHPEVDLGP